MGGQWEEASRKSALILPAIKLLGLQTKNADHIWMNAKYNHMKMMADKGRQKKTDSDSKVYCNEKQWACWRKKKPLELMRVILSEHTHLL